MPFTQEQFDTISQAARGILSKPCTNCETTEWVLHDSMIAMPNIDVEEGKLDFEKVYGVIALRCSKCQLTHFFNAAALGI